MVSSIAIVDYQRTLLTPSFNQGPPNHPECILQTHVHQLCVKHPAFIVKNVALQIQRLDWAISPCESSSSTSREQANLRAFSHLSPGVNPSPKIGCFFRRNAPRCPKKTLWTFGPPQKSSRPRSPSYTLQPKVLRAQVLDGPRQAGTFCLWTSGWGFRILSTSGRRKTENFLRDDLRSFWCNTMW